MGDLAVSMVGMADEARTTYAWLRDLDGETESLADVVGAPGELSITQRLDTIEHVLRQQMSPQFVARPAAAAERTAPGARPGRCHHRCGAAGACFVQTAAVGKPRLLEVVRHPSPSDR